MQRSSETIGAIAAALAKAQAELTNPEKSRSDHDRAGSSPECSRSALAALSSGLDIVRKALGGHEIATVQTTAIDKEAGLMRLHHDARPFVRGVAVVGLAGLPDRRDCGAAPVGTALTYARRYALFTLVGIAGEDDLDAPDFVEGAKGDAAEKAGAADKDLVAARLRPPPQ